MSTDDLVDLAVSSVSVTPEDAQVRRPLGVIRSIPESVSDAMNAAPLGSMYDILYSSLCRRLKDGLTEGTLLNQLLQTTLVSSAVNFRAVAPGFGTSTRPTQQPRADGTGVSPQTQGWGRNKTNQLPVTLPLDETQTPLSDPSPNDGVLIAKLVANLQHLIPCVLFNVTSKISKPVNVGGGSATSKYFDGEGNIVTQYTSHYAINVDLLVVTQDETAAGNLQALVEGVFGVYRDLAGDGAYISGNSWSIVLPSRLPVTSPITEVDSPWAQSDTKNSKLYTSTVTLEEVYFECSMFTKQSIKMDVPVVLRGAVTIRAPRDNTVDPGADQPLTLRIGGPAVPLEITNLEFRDAVLLDLRASNGKNIVRLLHPKESRSGLYELLAMRQGTCDIVVASASSGTVSAHERVLRETKPKEKARRTIRVVV